MKLSLPKTSGLEITMLPEKKSASDRHMLHVFSHMWNLVDKDIKLKGRSPGDMKMEHVGKVEESPNV